MKFRSITPKDYESVRLFLAEVGWRDRISDPEKFQKMLEHTNRTVVAFDDSRVVGFARALCDEVSNGYISMVAVAADNRGQGIGRELVRHLIRADTGITWILKGGSRKQRILGASWVPGVRSCNGESSDLKLREIGTDDCLSM